MMGGMARLTPIGITMEAFDEIYVLSFRHNVTIPGSAIVEADEGDLRWLRGRLDTSTDPYGWSVDPVTGVTYVRTDDSILGAGAAALVRGELHQYRKAFEHREG